MSQWMANRLVKRGARMWDEKIPDWFEQIDISTLDMSQACRCIVGQLGGRELNLDRLWHNSAPSYRQRGAYSNLVARLFGKRAGYTYEQEVLHGFNVAYPYPDRYPVVYAGRRVRVSFPELHLAWLHEIETRRVKAAAP